MALIELLILERPSFIPSILLILGILYFNYRLTRNYPHFHWNLFMIAVGLFGIALLIGVINILYQLGGFDVLASAVTALSAVLFAVTAYTARLSDKKWQH